MIHVAKHKLVAIGICAAVNLLIYFRDGFAHFTRSALLLGALLVLIFLSKLLAWLASWEIAEALASNHGAPVSSGFVNVFLWMLFLAACVALLLNWGIY